MSLAGFVYASGGGVQPILRVFIAPDADTATAQAGAGEVVQLGSANQATQYLDDGILTFKDALPGFDLSSIPADGVAETTAVGLPADTHYTVIGPGVYLQGELPDGEIALTFDTPGDYRVTLRAVSPQWLVLEAVINAY